MKAFFYVFIGSGLGGALRFLLSNIISRYAIGVFPFATFLINIIACFIVGFISVFWGEKTSANIVYNSLFAIGFCGGFSTFSTFGIESFRLFKANDYLTFSLYLALSVVLGVIAVGLGTFAASKL